jgi:hypothetical protein
MLNRIEHLLPGSIVFAQDFSGDGTQESVRQQLVQLTRAGILKRLSQGVYVLPKKLREHGNLLPSPEEIATSLARRDMARIIASGEVALWKLGLSAHVPLNYIYLTDGPSRVIKVGEVKDKTSYSIKFKHAAPKNFSMRGKTSSQVIQALKAIGEKNLNAEILSKIESLVMRENIDDLNYDLTVAPAWITKLIKNYFNSYKQ